MDPAPRQHHSPDNMRSVLSTVAILIIAPVIAVTLTLFVFQSYQVSGQSMESTLQDSDRLIIWKLPKTWAKITGHDYIPHRGDIVVLNSHTLTGFNNNGQKQIIKRVIALPGERVVVRNDGVTVYNDAYPTGFQPDKTLPYSKQAGISVTEGNIDLTIPAGEVFVLGDNRGYSQDSRMLGTIPVKEIVGKLTIRILPFNKMDTF